MLGDELFRVMGRMPQGRQGGFVADISQGYANIAKEPTPFRAKNRGARKALFEALLVEREQFEQIGCVQLRDGMFLHETSGMRKPVPRARRQAIITAKNSITNGGSQLNRDRAF
jgi:hypothetical protein